MAGIIKIDTIASQTVGNAFIIKGTLSGYTKPPDLRYRDNLRKWTVLPAGSQTSTIAFSFIHPAVSTATSSMIVTVRNFLVWGERRNSNVFAVIKPIANVPGPPTNLALKLAALNSLTVGFAPPTGTAPLDAGSYELQHRTGNHDYVAGPTVPYCTPAKGSITDAAGVVWKISASGVVQSTKSGITTTDARTKGTTQLMLVNGRIYGLMASNSGTTAP